MGKPSLRRRFRAERGRAKTITNRLKNVAVTNIRRAKGPPPLNAAVKPFASLLPAAPALTERPRSHVRRIPVRAARSWGRGSPSGSACSGASRCGSRRSRWPSAPRPRPGAPLARGGEGLLEGALGARDARAGPRPGALVAVGRRAGEPAVRAAGGAQRADGPCVDRLLRSERREGLRGLEVCARKGERRLRLAAEEVRAPEGLATRHAALVE